MSKLENPLAADAPAPHDLDELVQEDRVHRLLYTDAGIFRDEMTHIFGGTWVYLAHESQIPNANDFITGKLGLRPLIISRDSEGTIRALYNRCTHRGTTLCRWEKGNARSFQCPYHGWNFLNTGKLRGVPWADGYAERLFKIRNTTSRKSRGWKSYRGLHFRHAQPSAPPSIEKHLGPIKKPIDEWLDRNPGGQVTVVRPTDLSTKATGSSPTTTPPMAITSSSPIDRCSRPRTASRTRYRQRACPTTSRSPTSTHVHSVHGQWPPLQR